MRLSTHSLQLSNNAVFFSTFRCIRVGCGCCWPSYVWSPCLPYRPWCSTLTCHRNYAPKTYTALCKWAVHMQNVSNDASSAHNDRDRAKSAPHHLNGIAVLSQMSVIPFPKGMTLRRNSESKCPLWRIGFDSAVLLCRYYHDQSPITLAADFLIFEEISNHRYESLIIR